MGGAKKEKDAERINVEKDFSAVGVSIGAWLESLASKVSVPGGGGVLALSAALAAALVSMVANFTVGKKGYEEFSNRSVEIVSGSEDIMLSALKNIGEDARCFSELMTAYKDGAKDSDYKASLQPSLNVAKAVIDLLPMLEELAEHGNKNLLSDVGISASMAGAALKSAKINMAVNYKYIKDMKIRNKYRIFAEKEIEDAVVKAEKIEKGVFERISEGL